MRLLSILKTGALFAIAGCGHPVGYFAPVDPVSGSVPRSGIVQHLVPDTKSGVKVQIGPSRAQVALDDQGKKRVIAGLAVEVVNDGSGAERVAAERARLKPAHDQVLSPVRVERVGEDDGEEVGEKEETVSARNIRNHPNRRFYSNYNYGYAPYYPYRHSYNYYPYHSGNYGHYYRRRHGYHHYGHHGYRYGRRYGHYRHHGYHGGYRHH